MSRHVVLGTEAGRRVLAGDLSVLNAPRSRSEIVEIDASPSTQPVTDRPGAKTEAALAGQLEVLGIPFEREFEFGAALGRFWRADFRLGRHVRDLAGGIRPVIVEIDGGAHRTKKRFAADMAKRTTAQLCGYLVVCVSPDQVRSGEAITIIRSLPFVEAACSA